MPWCLFGLLWQPHLLPRAHDMPPHDAWLCRLRRRRIELVTLGQPRVGDPKFSRLVETLIQRRQRILSNGDVGGWQTCRAGRKGLAPLLHATKCTRVCPRSADDTAV